MSSEDVARLLEKQKATSLQRFWKKEEIVNNVPQEKKIYENSFDDSKRTDDRFSENFCKQDVRNVNVKRPGPIGIHKKRGGMDKTKSEIKFFDNNDNWNIWEHPSEESKDFDEEFSTKSIIGKPSEVRNHRELNGHNKNLDTKRLCKSEEKIEDEDSLLASNSILSELDSIQAKPQNGEDKQEASDGQTMNKETEAIASSGNKELFEIDETDYYDSEDEYWDTHPFDESFLDYLDDYQTLPVPDSHKGRFSKGLEQLANLPVFRRSIHKFAFDNNFEVHDVKPDGNCMFRALSDQFLINGFPGHTEISLRTDAINYLRSHSSEEGGAHASSFLSEESWEDYLVRMERSGEWGDHIMLQALVNVFFLEVVVFNVFQEDIRRTEVIAESKERFSYRLTIYLGHLGEFHYMSLRPKNWLHHWPYRALLGRLLVCSTNETLEAREKVLQEKLSTMHPQAGKYIPQSELEKIAGFVSHHFMKQQSATHQIVVDDQFPHSEPFNTYSGQDLQLNETEDSLQCLIEDPLQTDPISGIPLPHLAIIITLLIPTKMIEKSPSLPAVYDVPFNFLGSTQDGSLHIHLKDISKAQKMRAFYNKYKLKFGKKIAILKDHIRVRVSDSIPDEEESSSTVLCFDDSDTSPGYCRLKYLDGQVPKSDQNTLQTEHGLFLQGFDLSGAFLENTSNDQIRHCGIRMDFCYVGMEWFLRRPLFDFPSRSLKFQVFVMYCTLIPKAHHLSKNPAIEWKIDFSIINGLIMENFTYFQRYGFAIFKVLLENLTFHLEKRLKLKHLKAVFFSACEEFPSCIWKSNLGGCLLFVISKLLICLKKRFLPHYFIPQRNLLDSFSAQDLDALCVFVESIRVFPVQVTQLIVEKHGFSYGPNLVRSILTNTKLFTNSREMNTVVDHGISGMYGTARYLSRFGYYHATCELLERIHDLTKLSPGNRDPESFYNFFDGALQLMKQRSSRVILAKLYDKRFGTAMVNKYFLDSKQSLGKCLSWDVDLLISWLEVPASKSGDLISIAEFLYDQSLREKEKRNRSLSISTIETAIKCIKYALQEDSIGVENIDDKKLKDEILAQKRELKAMLKKYYIQVYHLSKLTLSRSPLINHMPDIEDLCNDFPEMSLCVGLMFRFLGQREKTQEYARKGK